MRLASIRLFLATVILCPLASSQTVLDTIYTPPGYEDGPLMGTVYMPDVPNGVAVVLSHAMNDTRASMSVWSDTLAAHGYTAMTIDYYDWGYRTLSAYPKPIRAFKTAVQFLRRNAARFNITTGRIVGLGQSEGSVTWGQSIIWDNDYKFFGTDSIVSDHLDAAVLFYGLYDTEHFLRSYSWWNFDSAFAAYFSLNPALRSTKGNCVVNVGNITTPVLLIHGTADSACHYEQSVEMHDSLLAHGKPCQLVLGPWEHQFDYCYWLQPCVFTSAGLVAKDTVLAFLFRTVPVSLASHADRFTIDRAYLRPGKDSVLVTACLMSQPNHTCVLSAIVSDAAGLVRDSLRMFNDGTHGDLVPNDSIWACYIRGPMDENTYKVIVRTDDISEGRFVRQQNAVQFTTAGPLVLQNVTYVDYRDAGQCSVRPSVKNMGSTAPFVGGTISLTCADTGVFYVVPAMRTFSTIAAGATGQADNIFSINYDPGKVNGSFTLHFTIGLQGHVCWDTTYRLTVTGVAAGKPLPIAFALEQNYPNPFNPSTIITYELPRASRVTLTVYDILGREVSLLVNEKKDAGVHEVTFDAAGLASGVYFYRLQAGSFVDTKKLLLVR
jgi:hypothetical protein